MEFIITQTDEVLVSHSGLALAGALLGQSPLRQRLNEIRLGERKRPEVSHGDVLFSMIGLLCLRKSDYADIETYRQEEFFRRALGLKKLPSEETLRQWMDQLGTAAIAQREVRHQRPMLSLGLVAYNLLRLCGQTALAENQSMPPETQMPLSKPVFRRRLRSVIQDLMYFAARLTRHSNRWGLSL